MKSVFSSINLNGMSQALKEFDEFLSEWTKTSYGRREFLALSALLLSACASGPKTRYREGDNTGQAANLTPAQEKQMTREVLPEMRKEYPPLNDPWLQAYVSNLGNKIVTANGLHQKPYVYNFAVVDVAYVNAFALPAGTVFITAPLMEMAESEAELAGVIGHEIGHIQARHTAERMYAAEKAQGKSWIYAVGGGVLGAAAGFGLGRLACPPKDSKCRAKALQLGAAAGIGGGLLVQKFGFMANSREDEMEADRIGFRTSVAAGYDKDQVGLFYEKLLAMEQNAKKKNVPLLSSLQDAMSTHPPSKERVQQMRQMAARQPENPKALVSSKTFDQARARASQYAKRARSKAS